MAEIDKQLFDDLIKYQVSLNRYGNKQAADMLALLKDAEKEIIAKLQKWGDSQLFTPARLKRLLAEVQQLAIETYATAGDTLRAEMLPFAEHAATVTGAMLASQLPVDWSDVKMSAEQLAAILDKTPIRIGQNKSLLFDEIFRGLAGGMEEKVRGAIRLGQIEGESAHQMASRVSEVLTGSKRDLYNLTHSVVQSVNNQAAQATFANNSEVLKGWIYMATFDSKTCAQCFSFSGKTYPLGKGPIPTLHVGCRCYQAPQVKTFRELGIDRDEFAPSTRASSAGQVKADLSFNDWLKGQSRKTQDELLGPTRGKMFADGRIKLDKFTDSSGKLYTLDQLKKHR